MADKTQHKENKGKEPIKILSLKEKRRLKKLAKEEKALFPNIDKTIK